MSVRVEIKYDNSKNSKINYYEFDFHNANNISTKNVEQKGKNIKPFILGHNKFWDNCVFANKFDGVIFKQHSNNDYTTDLSFVIRGNELTSITIVFDKEINEYATLITINGVQYTNDDIMFFKTFSQAYNELTIRFNKWSNINSPIHIKRIYTGLNEVYSKEALKSVSVGKRTPANSNQPEYGFMSQYGSFEIYDVDKSIENYIKDGVITDKTEIYCYYKDYLLGSYYSNTLQYSPQTRVLDVQVSDGSHKYANTYVEQIPYLENKNAFDLFLILFSYCGKKDYVMTKELENKLKNINIKYFYEESGSLLSKLNEFGNITQTNIFINSDDNLEVVELV